MAVRKIAGRVQTFQPTTHHFDFIGIPPETPLVPVTLAPPSERVFLSRASPDFALDQLSVEVLNRVNAPIYFETDDQRIVERILVPRVGRVLRIGADSGGSVPVVIDGSAMRLKMAMDTDECRDYMRKLHESLKKGTRVVVSVDPRTSQIVHVVPSDVPFSLADVQPPLASITVGTKAIDETPSIAQNQAETLFQGVAGETCDPDTPARGCIPFDLVGDGCWVRAEQICAFLRARNVTAGKIWIYGKLHVDTRKTLSCAQDWDFHVAAFVCTPRVRVIDPALFDHTVTIDDWMRRMNDPNAQVEFSGAGVYVMPERNNFRGQLPGELVQQRARFVVDLVRLNRSPDGPLPFDHCPIPAAR